MKGTFTTEETGRFFSCTDSSIRRQITAGKIEGIRFGVGRGTWKIPRRELVRITDEETVALFEAELEARAAA